MLNEQVKGPLSQAEVLWRQFSAQYEQSERDKMPRKGQSSLSVEVGEYRLGRLVEGTTPWVGEGTAEEPQSSLPPTS